MDSDDMLNSNDDGAPSFLEQGLGVGTNALNSFFGALAQNAAGQVIPAKTSNPVPSQPAATVPAGAPQVPAGSGAGAPPMPSAPIDWTKWGLIAVGVLVAGYVGFRVVKAA